MSKALIIVDVQNDFCEGGRLAVPGGAEVAYRINRYVTKWGDQYSTIVATADYHEADNDNGGHFSLFPDYVNTWPVHCTQGHTGSELHEEIENMGELEQVFVKGQGRPDYSGFQGRSDWGEGEVELDEWLRNCGIDEVDVVGIAGDFCVKATALDAKRLGYAVRILPEYVASVGGDKATLAAISEVETTTFNNVGRD